MKFKIDENLPVDLANLLRAYGHDAETVYDEDLVGAPDPDIVARCQAEVVLLLRSTCGTRVEDRVTYAVLGGSLVNKLFVAPDVRRIFDFRQKRPRALFQDRRGAAGPLMSAAAAGMA